MAVRVARVPRWRSRHDEVSLLLLLFLMILGGPHCAAWSGGDAHSIVMLSGIDDNEALRSAFYDGPAGTVISVSPVGYGVAQSGEKGQGRWQSWATPISDATEAPVSCDGVSGCEALPMRTRLSDEWVVLEKPQESGEALFLHCRLPLPQQPEEVLQREAHFTKRYSPYMEQQLLGWWHRVAQQRPSGCLFGDGEGAATGVARFYELCPLEAVYRVKPHKILASLGEDKEAADDSALHGYRLSESFVEFFEGKDVADEGSAFDTIADTLQLLFMGLQDTVNRTKRSPSKVKAQRQQDEAAVGHWLQQLHKSKQTRHAAHSADAMSGVFERIGEYHEVLSLPRWSRAERVWRMVYPSTQPCEHHFTTTAAAPQRGRPPHVEPDLTAEDEEADARAGVSPHSPYWKTIVHFRCPIGASASAKKHWGRVDEEPLMWSITEVRQVCRYEVVIDTNLVCGWEREYDNLRVNPIPCVALN